MIKFFFHSLCIYGADTWYICDRRVLLLNITIYLVLIVYEFLVSISPVGPTTPKWTLMNVETSANSLSRSNYFNLFVIFFDALVVLINDVNRSKYMMLVKKRKRGLVGVPPSKESLLKKLWLFFGINSLIAVITFILFVSYYFLKLWKLGGSIIVSVLAFFMLCLFVLILYHSSGSKSRKIFYYLMHECRVLFILLLLVVLFYIDNIYHGYATVQGVIFPLIIMMLFSFDFGHVFSSSTGISCNDNHCTFLYQIFVYTFWATKCKIYMEVGHLW